jgi:hypothetical protein
MQQAPTRGLRHSLVTKTKNPLQDFSSPVAGGQSSPDPNWQPISRAATVVLARVILARKQGRMAA